MLARSLALAAAAGLASAAAAQTVEFVAGPLGAAPGVQDGFFTATFLDGPVIDGQGRVLFRANLVQNGNTVVAANARGLWAGTPGTLGLVLRSGDAAPGLPGLTLNAGTGATLSSTYRFTTNGTLHIGSNVAGPGVLTSGTGQNDTVQFIGTTGNLAPGIRRWDAAAGTGFNINQTVVFSQQSFVMNDAGLVCFRSTFSDTVTTTDSALFTGLPGSLSIVAREGDVVPGTGGGKFASATGGFLQIINASGQILYDASLVADATTTPPVTTNNDKCFFVYTPGQGSTMVIREGDPAPGTVGATFNISAGSAWSTGSGAATFNNAGQHFFRAEVFGGDVNGTVNNSVYYMWQNGVMNPLWRKGDPAPASDGLLASTSDASMCLNNNGEVAFWGILADAGNNTVTAENDWAIWVGTPAGCRIVAREGDPAPGTDAFLGAATNANTFVGSGIFNDQGIYLFQADLRGGTVPANSRALYAYVPGRGLVLLARSGQTFDVFGTPRNVSTLPGGIQFTNGGGGNISLNNNGQLATRFIFEDSTNAIARITINLPCYANCDGSTIAPVLNVNDFVCFQTKYAAGDPTANCDGSTIVPVLNVNDFICFQTRYAAGCP